jgi:hypothetical protein
MLALLTRRLLLAIILPVISLFAAPSALGAHHSRPERSRAVHRWHTHGKHHRAYRRSGKKANNKSGQKADSTSVGGSQIGTFDLALTPIILGSNVVQSHQDYLSAGQAEAFSLQATASGFAGAIHLYIDSRNRAGTVVVGLYSNAGNRPGSLLSTGSGAASTAGTWTTVSIAPSQLTSGTTYWLAILGEGGTLRYRDHGHGPCPSQTSAQTSLGELPASWSTGRAYADCPASAYVTSATTTEPPPVESPPPPPPPPVEESPPPPPPAAPTNSALPTINGTPTEGETLTAVAGSWTGSPTSYAYQWQDCNTFSEGCLNISGASTPNHTLQASDVSHKIRVVVTATNAGGSTPATSATTEVIAADPPPPPPPPSPPTASFTYAPSSPGVEQPVTFDATGSSCPDSPCTYGWSDDGSTTQPILPLWPLGSGQTLQFTFSVAGTKYVRLVVTDAIGRTATIEHDVLVEGSPLPPAPPVNTVLPAISGVATEGQALQAASGAWTGSPASFAYQWQDCDSSGAGCVNVNGATASSYQLAAADVGHTLRVVVRASNEGGSTPASSAATALVTAVSSPPPPAPTNTVVPSVSGSTVEGETLSASVGIWTGSPTSYTYQWQDCDVLGEGCSNISGATASSYTLASSDVGHTLRAVVSASNTGGSMSASSAATAVVSASGGGSAACTTTVSNLASVVSLSSEEPDGSTICIADGSYGTLTLTAARAGYVTIAAANGPGHVTLSGLTFSSAASHLKLDGLDCTCNTQLGLPVNGGTGPNNIQITRTDSQGFQVEAGSHDLLFDHDYSHAGPYGFLLNGSRYPVAGGCCRTANYPLIENVTISNSKVGPVAASGADAFQVKGFNNVRISNNDIYDIYQNGNHNDGVQTVHGGSNLTITHNYFHDGNVELFMIKDGDVMGTNFITDNLVVRENSSLNPACGGCSTAVFGQYYSPQNATIANNTIVEPGLFLRSQLGLVGNGNPDYLVPSNINVNHNVINEFRAQDDDQGGALGSFAGAMTTSYNMFGPYTKNYLTAGTGDTFVKTINNTSSIFVNPSSNDFRLASNPNNIGVDWKPSEYHYGP